MWTETLTGVMNKKGYKYTLIYPPGEKDPTKHSWMAGATLHLGKGIPKPNKH